MHYFLTILTRFGVKGLNLITFLILAHLLVLEDFSLYGQIFNTSLLLSILLDLGLRNSSAYFIGKSNDNFLRIIRLINGYVIFVSLIFVCFTFSVNIIGKYNVSQSTVLSITIICLGLFLIRTFQGILLGLTEINIVNKADLLQKMVLLVGVVTIACLSINDIELVLWVFALSVLFTSIYLVLKINEMKSEYLHSHSYFPPMKLFTRGFIFMLSAFTMIFYKKVGFYIANSLGGEVLSGIYFGIDRFSEVSTEIGIAVSMVLFSKNVKSKERSDIVDDVAKIIRVCLLVLFCLTAFFMLFSKQILTYGLGNEFSNYRNLYNLALISAYLGLVPTVIFPTLTILYRPIYVAFLYLLALTVNCFLSYFLYGRFQLYGIVFSMLAINFVLTITIVSFVCIFEKYKIRNFFVIKTSDVAIMQKFLRKRSS